jgi:hypothetical protein
MPKESHDQTVKLSEPQVHNARLCSVWMPEYNESFKDFQQKYPNFCKLFDMSKCMPISDKAYQRHAQKYATEKIGNP